MTEWKVAYEIDGTEYEAIIPDGSDPVSAKVRYIGYDEDAFDNYIEANHFGVKMDDVDVVHAIRANHPLARFF